MLVVLDQKVEERSKDIWKIDTQMDPGGAGTVSDRATSTQLNVKYQGCTHSRSGSHLPIATLPDLHTPGLLWDSGCRQIQNALTRGFLAFLLSSNSVLWHSRGPSLVLVP